MRIRKALAASRISCAFNTMVLTLSTRLGSALKVLWHATNPFGSSCIPHHSILATWRLHPIATSGVSFYLRPGFTLIAVDPLISFCTLPISKSVSSDPIAQMEQKNVFWAGGLNEASGYIASSYFDSHEQVGLRFAGCR